MYIINEVGQIAYKTKSMGFHQAIGFGKCLEANGNFERVQIVGHAQGGFCVTYVSRSQKRNAKLLKALGAERKVRAKGNEYTLLGGGVYECKSAKSGNTYRVSATHCTCPDWQRRASRLGIPCKHQSGLPV